MLASTVAGCNGSNVQSSGEPSPVPKPGPESVYCSNNADSQISALAINAKTGALTFQEMALASGGTSLATGAAGMVAAPNSNFLYVANQKTSQIFGCSINSKNGNLTPTAQGSINTGKETSRPP